MNSVCLDGVEVYPSKLVCVGRNYVEHIQELNNEMPSEPVIFVKPNSAISDELYCDADESVHYEGEISFLVRSGALYGVGFGLDLTKREVQSALKAKGLPWERAKAFDRSAVFSEFVHYTGNLSDLGMELYINDVRAQHAEYELMLNKPLALLDEITSFMSLEDNDLIMTGTPKGVGRLNPGDKFTARIFEKERTLMEKKWTVRA